MLRRFVLVSAFAAFLAVLAPAAGASPVATSDGEYQALGRVFPDPLANCQRAQSDPCSPNAQGNVPAAQFIQFNEFLDALEYMNQRQEWQRYMEVWPLDGKLGDGAGNGRDPDVKGNNLGRVEFNPEERFRSAGLPQTDTSRAYNDLVVVRVTDENVPDAGKKRLTLSLSIHGIERAGVEGGTRAMEDLVTAFTTQNAGKTVVPTDVDPGAPTFADVLKSTIVYFTYPNPDGWQRGSVSNGGVFFQRYNGNGVDPNRDWPDIGYTFRPYSGLSEPETRAFASFYDQVRSSTGSNFAAGDDLHGMNEADALSYTLLPHGKHDYNKDIRIRETAKTIHRASEKALSWSPIIQPNDAPQGGGVPCAPGLGTTCARIYGQTWGTVYDTIDYTTTGTLGDWFDSQAGLNADGIDNEMAFSHVDRNIVFDPHTEQLHVDGNKALIYAHLAEIVNGASGKFDPPGRKGYVPTERLKRGASIGPNAPAGSQPHEPIEKAASDCTPDPGGCAFEYEINGPNVYNGGMRVDVSASNVSGIGTGTATLKVQCQGCDVHREREDEDEKDEWTTVAEDYNQASLPPLYAQAGLTAAVNYPQATKPDGSPVKWRALISVQGGTPRARIEFTSDRATTDGATGGDSPPELKAYDVANTDFFRDLDRFVANRREDFDAIDPEAVIAGRQSLDSFDSIALADDPMPGYGGSYGGRTRPTGGPTADIEYEGSASPPAGDTEGSPSSYHEQEFNIGPNDSDALATIRIEWISPTSDFDMEVLRVDGDKRVQVGESASLLGTTNSEEVVLKEPPPGKYIVRVKNYASPEPTFNGTIKFQPFPAGSGGGKFSTRQKDQWAAKLREWVEGGGNLILTDGALRILPEITGIPDSAINRQTVYTGQTTFATREGVDTLKHRLSRNVDQPGSRFASGGRRQMFEPTPLGFAIQAPDGEDQSHARQYDVDFGEWEKAGGTVAGTSADAGDRDAAAVYDRVTLGELRKGKGRVRIAGALLPQPSTEFDHPLGIEPYALTFTGYIVVRNLFDTTARGLGGLPGEDGSAGRNFVISRRAVKLRKRVAGVRVSCRSPRGCRGTLVLKIRKIVRVRGKRRAKLIGIGKRKFNYPAKRRNAVLRVKLTRKGARRVGTKKRRQRITAVASVRFGDGTRAKPSRKFWLYRPSGRRR